MVYIHCDKKRQSLVLGGFWSTEQHQNQLKEQGLNHNTLHSIFIKIKLLDDLNGTHWYTVSLLSLFISVCLALSHAHCLLLCPFLPSFCVSAQSDLNCNNIVNWGYCKWRSEADRQPLFPALTAPHHSRKDTWFLNPHLAVPHLHCLLRCEPRPDILVESPHEKTMMLYWKITIKILSEC